MVCVPVGHGIVVMLVVLWLRGVRGVLRSRGAGLVGLGGIVVRSQRLRRHVVGVLGGHRGGGPVRH